MGRIIRNTISYGFVTLILAALGFCIYLFLDDLDGPEVTMTPDTGRISPTQEITLKLADAKSGVRSVVVTIHRNNQSLVILDKVFRAGPRSNDFVQPQERGPAGRCL